MRVQSVCQLGLPSSENVTGAGGTTSELTLEALGKRLQFFFIGLLSDMQLAFPR